MCRSILFRRGPLEAGLRGPGSARRSGSVSMNLISPMDTSYQTPRGGDEKAADGTVLVQECPPGADIEARAEVHPVAGGVAAAQDLQNFFWAGPRKRPGRPRSRTQRLAAVSATRSEIAEEGVDLVLWRRKVTGARPWRLEQVLQGQLDLFRPQPALVGVQVERRHETAWLFLGQRLNLGRSGISFVPPEAIVAGYRSGEGD